MNFKKFSTSDNQWHDVPYYQHKTATDTLTLPAVIYPNDTSITVGLKGNEEHTGTPSPQNPVDVNGTGERTKNVMPAGEQKTVENNGITFSSDGNGRYHISGTATAFTTAQFNLLSAFTTPISVSNGGQGTLSFFNTQSDNNVTFVFYNGTTKVDDWKQTPIRRMSTAYNAVGNKYVDNVLITVNSGATVDMTITPEFTNDGILPSEFEPYGYKIPISSANTTTPVYLGEVQSTRRIKKLVFDGTEAWRLYAFSSATNVERFYLVVSENAVSPGSIISSHFPTQAGNSDTEHMRFGGSPMNEVYIYISRTVATTVADLKAYLAQQYANGTPVCVWYVLATEETGIVNEPLMKIGDYADSLTTSIPVTAGENTLDVQTTVAPSEVTANYQGWHPVQSVHERENDSWT